MKTNDFFNGNIVTDDDLILNNLKYGNQSLALEESQLMLKYARREKRTINDKTYELAAPSDKTSNVMQKIASSNTLIEVLLEQGLKNQKINYAKPGQLIKPIAGNPDFVIPKFKIAIFCDGAFWHGFQIEKSAPKTNGDFWKAKIESNIERDRKVNLELAKCGWKVFRFWEHDIKNDVDRCVRQVKKHIEDNVEISNTRFTFVDLFSGVGGFRIALEELGGKCIGFSEIDKPAIEVYKSNFCNFLNRDEAELGDITKVGKLPFKNIDLIVGGVPCQSWSVAGKMRGFEDPRGRLWNDTLRVVKENQPKAFMFENVKGLMDPRNKSSLNLIESTFREAGYVLQTKLLNSYDFGLPQNRDRIFLVGIRNDIVGNMDRFKFPEPINTRVYLKDVIDNLSELNEVGKKIFAPSEIFGSKVPMGRTRFQKTDELNDFFIFCDTRNGHTTIHSWDIIRTSEREKEICMTILRNRRKKLYGNADGNPLSYLVLVSLVPNLKESELDKLIAKKILRFIPNEGYEFVNSKNSAGVYGIYRVYLPHSQIFSTLTATGTKDMIALKSIAGSTPEEYRENFIKEVIRKKLYRPISAKEYGKLQGFPDWFVIHKDEKLAKKQFGNAVSTNVISHLAKSLLKTDIFDFAQCYDRQGKDNRNI